MEQDPNDMPRGGLDQMVKPPPNDDDHRTWPMDRTFQVIGTCNSWITKVTVAIVKSDGKTQLTNVDPQDATIDKGGGWATGKFGPLNPSDNSYYRVQATFYENDYQGMPTILTTFTTVKITVS
jgi:hypothetical protein